MPPLLILGSSGFLGSSFLRYLIDINFETNIFLPVRSFPIFYKSVEKKNIHIIEGDIYEKVKELSQTRLKNQPYIVVTFIGSNTNSHDQQIKIINLYKNLKKILKQDSSFKIINISSSSVYGGKLKGPIKENTQLKPDTVYGKSKKEVEEIFQDLIDLKEIYNLRVGNVIGTDRLTSQISRRETNLIRLEMYSDGKSAKRSFIDPRTLNQIILYILQSTVKSGNYNVATHHPHYMEDLLLEYSVDFLKIKSKTNNNQYITMNTKKLQAAIPFDLELCLEELVARSFNKG